MSPFLVANILVPSARESQDLRIANMPKPNLIASILHHPKLMPYNRLAVLVVLLNLCLLFCFEPIAGAERISTLSKMVLANFALATVIRSQYIVNLLFALATAAPLSWPIQIRWALAKVYHFGGIHVGAFFSGLCFLLLLLKECLGVPAINQISVIIFCTLNAFIFLTMIVSALPFLRSRYHNQFEIIARFGNWTSLLIFWALNFELGNSITSPPTFTLAAITTIVALPWIKLRRVSVRYVKPSNHVVLADFEYGVTPFAGSSTELSLNPLFEWHSFANVPLPNREGFKLTISRAGDWTGQLIEQMPTHIWVKGIPTAGVGNIEKLFKKVLWVATGSGIGPCLPHLLSEKVPGKLVWSTRNPEKTYGTQLVEDILRVQPDALIWDTDQKGKPNLVELTYQKFMESGAEAVICIANKKVTWQVVYEMERRGIPAFGAIWDS